MRIDLNSLYYNSTLADGNATKSWGTAVGQGKKFKITYPGAKDLLLAMDYCWRSMKNGCHYVGKNSAIYDYNSDKDQKYKFIKAAVFKTVFVKINEGESIRMDKPFAMALVEDEDGKKHLKYGDSLVVGDEKNENFYKELLSKIGLNTCFFAYEINVFDQDQLVISIAIVSKQIEEYPNSTARGDAWAALRDSLIGSLSAMQFIYYGVPGCGKSKVLDDEIKEKLKNVENKELHVERCVFHPEYSNADFVGQLYPRIPPDGKGVDYRFKPGPFSKILHKALHNSSEPYFLVIEEINRGNAAAIFGEMFQLLDRIRIGDCDEETSGNVYSKGWSAYGVTNDDVNDYLRLEVVANGKNDVVSEQERVAKEDAKNNEKRFPYNEMVSFNCNTAIRLPPNLFIYATMNISDQNVFTLDNAFQRRFSMRMVQNSLTDLAQYNLQIGKTGVYWGRFWEWINERILSPDSRISNAEDKCLGAWFIKGVRLLENDGSLKKNCEPFSKNEFAEKVLKYLWNDVFKQTSTRSIFKIGPNNRINSLSSLIKEFEADPEGSAFERIFELDDKKIKSLKTKKSK